MQVTIISVCVWEGNIKKTDNIKVDEKNLMGSPKYPTSSVYMYMYTCVCVCV